MSDPKSKWLRRVVIGIPLMFACLIVVAIMLPNFIIYRSRTPEMEAKANLKALCTAERAYFQERDAFSDDMKAIQFNPERGNRYAYYLAQAGTIRMRIERDETESSAQILSPDLLKYGKADTFHPRFEQTGCPITLVRADGSAASFGVRSDPGHPERSEFLFAVAGNLDHDPVLDCWSVASFDRRAESGEAIAAFEPYWEQQDRDVPK